MKNSHFALIIGLACAILVLVGMYVGKLIYKPKDKPFKPTIRWISKVDCRNCMWEEGKKPPDTIRLVMREGGFIVIDGPYAIAPTKITSDTCWSYVPGDTIRIHL